MPDFSKPAEKINPQDPEALKKAGFGNPEAKFNPEAEMAEVAADAAIVEAVNQAHEVSEKPVSSPNKKKARKKNLKTKKAPVQDPPEKHEDEEPKDEVEENEEGLSDDPAERLKQVGKMIQEEYGGNAPGPEQLFQWKQQSGDIFVLPLGERTFVYRYLKRAEWNKIQADESMQRMTELQLDDYLFDRCVLWPRLSVQEKAFLPAGLIGAVCEQIRINSVFVPPERLAQFTIKL